MTSPKKIPYGELPTDIQGAIESTRIDEVVEEITKKHSLHVDQAGVVYEITNSILLGRAAPTEFIPTLIKRGGIEHSTATEIAKEINEKVFLAVRESLKKIHGVGEGEMPRETAPLEKKNDVLQAIEAPESVPMRDRVVETPAVPTPSTAPRTPEAPEAPRVARETAPTPETPVVAAAETPTPAPAAKKFDPYREIAN